MAAQNFGIGKFDPELHPGNVYDTFCDFIDAFAYEYEAVAKEPPTELDGDARKLWIQKNKRRQLMGRFASRNLQKDFEDLVIVDERDSITFEETVKRLKERYKPTKNTTLANFEFHKLKQKPSESFDAFTNRVKHEAGGCEFSCASDTCTVKDVLVRDQIVIGTYDDDIRKKALNNEWPLTELVSQGRKLEAAAHGALRIKEEVADEQKLNRIAKPGKYSKKKKAQDKMRGSRTRESTAQQCTDCSSWACKGGKKCYAYGQDCFACGKTGHFKGAVNCKKSSKNNKKRTTRRVHNQDTDDSSSICSSDSPLSDNTGSSSDGEDQHIGRVKKSSRKVRPCKYVGHVRRTVCKKVRKTNKPKYQVRVVIKETPVTVYADTGADICVMSKSIAEELGLTLKKTRMRIKPFGSKHMRCVGYYVGPVMYEDTVANVRIYVVKKEVETLLSGPVSEALGIITFNRSQQDDSIRRVSQDPVKEAIVTRFPEVFNGIGKLKNHQVTLHIDDSVPSVASPPRPVPFHLKGRLRQEIKKMEEEGIVEEHSGPAPWVSNIVLAPKDDGGVRVTVDMRKPNEAIKDTRIPIPRPEEIRAQLAGSNVFSKLDFKSAFHQLELAPESRYMTVFHDGEKLKRYTRLTMGTKPASGELTKALRPLFDSIPSAHIIHDDLIIAAKSDEEHDKILDEVLFIIKQHGLTLNLEKCLFKRKEIPFWGMIYSREGVRPDPSKVQSLKMATRPCNKSEVMSFLCMLQANSEFIPNLAKETTHLRELTHKHKIFDWSSECEEEFERLKTLFYEDALLRYFDPDMKTFLFVDAHRSGLSVLLSQGESRDKCHVVACASRATTPIERRYPQLDLEALSVDFALRRFRQYIAGGPEVEVVTDHKPLVNIFKDTRRGSIRTDRIKLRHQDISYKVIWREGKYNPADYLSRHAVPWSKIPRSWKNETQEFEKTVWFLQFAPYTESISFDKMIEHTHKCEVLQRLKKCIVKGYIPKKDVQLQPYHQLLGSLTISDVGLVLKDDKIVLPESLWKKAVDKAHQGGHPGMTSLKRRLRSHFWIPKLNALVQKKVEGCHTFQVCTKKTTKEPIAPQVTTEYPWEEVNIDLFGPMPNNKHVLVVQDNMSRFPAAKIVPSTSSTPVIKALTEIYTSYGNPDLHRTDNGPPFNSKDFEEFSNQHGIQHVKVFPYHPQANPVETFMKPLGKALKAAYFNRDNAQQALDELLKAYRSTPHPATDAAPGSILFRKGYKTDFPRTILDDEMVEIARENDKQQKAERKEKTNSSNRRKTMAIAPGDKVIVKDYTRSKKFDPVYDLEPFTVIADDGKGLLLQREETVFRRHKDDVKPAFEKTEENGTKFDHSRSAGETQIMPPAADWFYYEVPEQADDGRKPTPEQVGNAQGPQENEQVSTGRPVRTRQGPRYLQDYVL